uniref:Reverse transcriptase domain-containing protein n=1 Tax=Tanacetum cinerariifolium TaxID=118510 RepID=A0A6L2J3J5_TANCI|nr:hypothetical protein [Tanacetum cinerariifolium]
MKKGNSITYLLEKTQRSYWKLGINFFTIHHAQPEDSNELFQKLLEDLKELAEYKESLENSSNEIATSNSNKEKEGPPQDSDIRQLIREECCVKVCEEQKQNMEDTMLELVKIYRQKELLCMHDNEQKVKNIVEQPAERRNHEIIKSGVEELVPILSENEVISEDKREYDLLVCENSPVCDDHSDILFDSNDDDISSDDDDFEDIEYVEASLPDPEIISVAEENVVYEEEEEIDLEDISQIQDVVLRVKLLSITQFETFCDHTKETRSGNTTTHADYSLPEYDSFYFEIEPDQERLINIVKKNIFDDSTSDPLLEEADLFLASDNLIPPGIENFPNDSEGDIRFLEALLNDDFTLFPNNESSESEDNPSFPRPPLEPPDFNLDTGDEISVEMNVRVEFECIDAKVEFDNDDYYSFMFVI